MSISYPLALLDLLAFADSSTADNTLASRAVSECVHKGIIYARNYSYEAGQQERLRERRLLRHPKLVTQPKHP